MNKIIDKAVVLTRVNYGERDRVVTMLAQNAGKISVFAKGVRAQKSKLSAGIELFNVNEIGYIEGKTNLKTLTSTQILVFNDQIVKDMTRTNLCFEALKLTNKRVEENHGQELFSYIETLFVCMNDAAQDNRIIYCWFVLHILEELGVMPDINVDSKEFESYYFDYENQIFVGKEGGDFSRNDIKLLRLLRQNSRPIKLASQSGSEDILLNFAKTLIQNNLD